MGYGITHIMASSKSRYFKVYFWWEKLDETSRSPRSYCALQGCVVEYLHIKFAKMHVCRSEWFKIEKFLIMEDLKDARFQNSRAKTI